MGAVENLAFVSRVRQDAGTTEGIQAENEESRNRIRVGCRMYADLVGAIHIWCLDILRDGPTLSIVHAELAFLATPLPIIVIILLIICMNVST